MQSQMQRSDERINPSPANIIETFLGGRRQNAIASQQSSKENKHTNTTRKNSPQKSQGTKNIISFL